MAREPENMVLAVLREIREKQDEHSDRFERLETRMRHVEMQLDDRAKVVTVSLGQSTEAKFMQSQQDARIEELFDRPEPLRSGKEPVQ
jgi:hypothetical protein